MAFAAWAVLVAVLLLLPGSVLPLPAWLAETGTGWLDKAVHGLLFFVLALLAAACAGSRFERPLLTAIVASSAYGTLLEGVQALLGTRSFEVADIVADVLGSILGGIVAGLAARR